uniref:hypothetical protein n=1 Tax=Algoriphagus sp. TaxID=1872435 RepID=UPI004047681A
MKRLPPTVVAPRFVLAAATVVAPVPPLATGRVPVTPVVSGNPVAFVKIPALGVPRFGVTKVGLVANTARPVPVSSFNAPARPAELASVFCLFDTAEVTNAVVANCVELVPAVAVGAAGVPVNVGD